MIPLPSGDTAIASLGTGAYLVVGLTPAQWSDLMTRMDLMLILLVVLVAAYLARRP